MFVPSETLSGRTRAIELPTVVMVYVRDDDGAIAAEVAQFESETLPADDYVLTR